jgi:hypothetical protein
MCGVYTSTHHTPSWRGAELGKAQVATAENSFSLKHGVTNGSRIFIDFSDKL